MHSIVSIACLFATPIPLGAAEDLDLLALVAEEPVDSELEWIDRLIHYLEWLCEIFGDEFCDADAGQLADPHMIRFIMAYSDAGVPGDLDDTERFRARTIVADLYELMNAPKSGTPSVTDAMAETLIAAYEDLGGDPADL